MYLIHIVSEQTQHFADILNYEYMTNQNPRFLQLWVNYGFILLLMTNGLFIGNSL